MAQIGIIGGGISGLTLAFLLKKKGHEVRVFEASEQTGGAIKTTRDRQGWMAEWGPNTIIESSERIKRLISMLDLEEKRCYPDARAKKRYIVRDHRMVAVPGSLSDLIRTPLLSRQAKWSLIKEPFKPRKSGQKITGAKSSTVQQQQTETHRKNRGGGKHQAESQHELATNETLASFVRRRLGEEFLRWPIDALVGGIYAGDPEKLSVRHAFPRLALLEEQHGSLLLGQLKGGVRRPAGSDEIPRNKAQIFSFHEGLQVLPDKLNSCLGDAVLCNAAVQSVSHISPEELESSHTQGRPVSHHNTPNHSESAKKDSAFTRERDSDRRKDTGRIADTIREKSIGRESYTGHEVDAAREREIGRKRINGRWKVTFTSPDNPPETFDVLIYAGTAHGIGNITFPHEMVSNLTLLTEIPHPPVVSLTLGFRRSDIAHSLDGFGVLVPRVEQLPILGTLFPSSLFPGRSPNRDHVTLTTYLGGMRQPEIADKSEEEQTKLICDTLKKIIGLAGKPLFRHRIVWSKAIPQYHLDHHRFLDAMDQIEQDQPGFYLAGNYRTGISVGDTINAAFDLTDRISEDLKDRIDGDIVAHSVED